MSVGDRLEALLVRTFLSGFRALGWSRSLALGASVGSLARALGLRRRVAEDNLARAFPDRSIAERDQILRAHYRELGRVVAEYSRLGELVGRPDGEVIAEVRGLEHLLGAGDRGAILLSGHFGNVELLGAYLGRIRKLDFVVRPLSNRRVEELIARERARAGVGRIEAGGSLRRVFEALRAGRWVAMLADQDARAAGVFVPFLGRPASTAVGPARIAIATGCPIVMGFASRREDGRHELDIEPPLEPPADNGAEAVERLTAHHAARLEAWVRKRPELWFWLHRRWKTQPPARPQRAPEMGH